MANETERRLMLENRMEKTKLQKENLEQEEQDNSNESDKEDNAIKSSNDSRNESRIQKMKKINNHVHTKIKGNLSGCPKD